MPWQKYITHNAWLKALSLGLAILVWVTYQGDRFRLRAITLSAPTPGVRNILSHPIVVKKDAKDPRAISIEPDRVDIQLAADDAQRLDRLNVETDIEAFVDLRNVRNDSKTARVQVVVPSGIRAERVTPREVTLDLLNP